MLSYRGATVDVPLPLVVFVSRLLADHRREIGTRDGKRGRPCRAGQRGNHLCAGLRHRSPPSSSPWPWPDAAAPDQVPPQEGRRPFPPGPPLPLLLAARPQLKKKAAAQPVLSRWQSLRCRGQPGCLAFQSGHEPLSEQRLASGRGNTPDPARRPGRRTRLERGLDGGGDEAGRSPRR